MKIGSYSIASMSKMVSITVYLLLLYFMADYGILPLIYLRFTPWERRLKTTLARVDIS